MRNCVCVMHMAKFVMENAESYSGGRPKLRNVESCRMLAFGFGCCCLSFYVYLTAKLDEAYGALSLRQLSFL